MNRLARGLILVELDESMEEETTKRLKEKWSRNRRPNFSTQDSKIFRLAHYDYCPESGPFTQIEIVEILNIPQQTVSDSLARLERIKPGLFPILSRFEARCVNLFLRQGYKAAEIAQRLNVSIAAVYASFKRVKKKGQPWARGLGRKLEYDAFTIFNNDEGTINWLDGRVKQKF